MRGRDAPLDDLHGVVQHFFEQAGAEVLSVSPDDFIAAFEEALAD